MNIDEVAKHFNVTKSKLRYYEKNGVIRPIQRNAQGNRKYSEYDLKWIEFFFNLKETGMSLKNIKHYIELKKLGDSTIEERKQILIDQISKIDKSIENLQNIKEGIVEQVSKYEEGSCIIKKNYTTDE